MRSAILHNNLLDTSSPRQLFLGHDEIQPFWYLVSFKLSREAVAGGDVGRPFQIIDSLFREYANARFAKTERLARPFLSVIDA